MRVPDILRVTTPVVNKSQAVAPKPSADAVSSFNVQNTSQVNALRQQSQAGNQNAGVLQDKDTPTLLLSLLKDPAVAVTYLQNLSLLEETFQLLPANNTTVTEERPPTSYLFTVVEVDVHNNAFLFIVRRAVMQFTLRACNKTAAPKLDTTRLS